MPNYKVHVVGGIAAGVGTMMLTGSWEHASMPTVIEYVGCCVLGSLFPDIDIKSKGQKIFYVALTASLLVVLWLHKTGWFIALSMLGMVPLLLRHRGLTHHPWFVGVCTGIPAFYLYHNSHVPFSGLAIDLIYFAIGAFSHMALDFGLFNFCRKALLGR